MTDGPTPASSQARPVNALLQQAIGLHRLGDLAQAERLYRDVLHLQPAHADAHHNLGVLATQTGQPMAGLPHFEAALQANPGQGQFWLSYIEALRQAGRLTAALQTLARGRSMGLKGDAVDALASRLTQAEAQARLTTTPVAPPAEQIDALASLFNTGAYPAAEQMASAMTERYPAHAFGWKALAAALQQQRRPQEALAAMQHAIALAPEDAEAHYNLANIAKALHRLDEAVSSFQRALQLNPEMAEAYSNLGNTLADMDRLTEAEASHRQALARMPQSAAAHNNLGAVLMALGRLDEAQACFSAALALAPGFAQAQSNLLFALNYHPDRTAEEIYAAYQDYGRSQRMQVAGDTRSRTAHARLRIGYVSPDFRHHSCRFFVEPLLAHHDRTAFEIFAYAELPRGPDAVSRRYQACVDHWVPTLGLSDEALAQRIRDDEIDILVDLAGHTAKNRLGVFARRPTPVSATWLGFGYTTGLSAIDYILTDEASCPRGQETLFAEQPWRLAGGCFAYRAAEGMGEPAAWPSGKTTVHFGTLTRAVRMNHRTIRAWSRILQRVPDSVLIVNSKNYADPAMQRQLKHEFAQHGIAAQRLCIGHTSPPWDVLRDTDITLDCFPHNSGTTLFESLYMGVPFVTLAGRPSVGRLGSSILHSLGRTEWIARSEDEYVEIAVALASDLPGLAAAKAGLRQQMHGSALMDEAGFARKMESAYQRMWDVAAGPPASDEALLP